MDAATDRSLSHPLDREVRLLLQAAMVIFTYTIGIGILNGLDLVEFSRQQLLSHLHGGTLGWLTLSILAVTLWLFGQRDSEDQAGQARVLAVIAVVSIAAYVAAFATTFGVARPLAGTGTLVALIGFALWAYARASSVTLTVPRLFVLLGLTNSVIGGLFGVVNGLAIAYAWDWLPESFLEAHPATMEVGFVIPAAMGIAEWGMRIGTPDEPAPRAGRVQVGFMAVAFLWVLGFTLGGLDEVAGMGIIFAIVGVIIFFVRNARIGRRISLMARSPRRHAMAGGVLLGVTIVYIFVAIQMAEGDFGQIPRGQLLSFIHLMAVGATTNALLAFVISLSRRVSSEGVIDDVVFWGVNVGLIGFVIALSSGVDGLIFVFVPLMGLGLLVAIAAHLGPLSRGPADTSRVQPAAAQ